MLALAKALSDSGAADQEYTFIVRGGLESWLAPYVHGPCNLESVPAPTFSRVRMALRWIAPLRYVWQRLPHPKASVAISDGFVESHGFDVVHFPTQEAYLTDLPSIYQPWDLQHLHYPEFFSQSRVRTAREGSTEPFALKRRAFAYKVSGLSKTLCINTELPREKSMWSPGALFSMHTRARAQSRFTLLLKNMAFLVRSSSTPR